MNIALKQIKTCFKQSEKVHDLHEQFQKHKQRKALGLVCRLAQS